MEEEAIGGVADRQDWSRFCAIPFDTTVSPLRAKAKQQTRIATPLRTRTIQRKRFDILLAEVCN